MIKHGGNMSNSLGDIFYKLEILTIEAYIVENNCYRATRIVAPGTETFEYTLYSLNSSAPYGSYNPEELEQRGYSKHFHNIPQEVRIYEPQSRVLCCIPAISNNPMRTRIGFILGELSTTALSNFIDKPVQTNGKSIHNVDMSAVDIFSNKLNQEKSDDYYKGNLQNDSIPGDYIIKGEYSKLVMDNYSTSVGTDSSNTHYSEITGELTERTKIKNTQDIISQSRTFIVDHKALKLHKYSLNPYKSYFDCYTIDDNGVMMKNPDVTPYYDLVYAHGDAVDGYYRTFYTSEDDNSNKSYPTFQETLKSDGSYQVNGTKTLRISKSAPFTHIDCTGSTFQDKDSKLKVIHNDMTELTQFTVKPEQAFAEDLAYEKIAAEDMAEDTKVKALLSYIDLEEDGSIKIRDAWGSYIYLHKGNIQLHSVNNLFVVPGRDYIQLVGGVESHTVAHDIQFNSINKNITMIAKENIESCANQLNIDVTSSTISSKQSSIIQSADIEINPKQGAVHVGSEKSEVIISAKDIIVVAQNTANICTPPSAIILDKKGNVKIHGKTQISGNLIMAPTEHTLKIGEDKEYILYSSPGSIFVVQGELYVSGMIGSNTTISAQNIRANSIASSSGKVGQMQGFTTQHIKNKLTKQTMPARTENALPFTKLQTYDDFIFTLNVNSINCTYKADPCELQGIKSLNVKMSYYSYPGKTFWENKGIVTVINDNITYQGFKHYGFTENNIIK